MKAALHLIALWFLFSAIDQAFLGEALTGQTSCSHFNDLVASLCAIIHWSEGRPGSAERPACFITTGGQSFPPQPCTSVRGDQTLSHMEMVFTYTYTHQCGGHGDQKAVWTDASRLCLIHPSQFPLSARTNAICCAYSACRRRYECFTVGNPAEKENGYPNLTSSTGQGN